MNCPKCDRVEMAEEQAGDVTIDRCPSCRGIWLDENELDHLLATEAKRLIDDDASFTAMQNDAGPRLNCPHCKGTYLIKLNSRLHPGTIIDSCTVCHGAWLDAGELAQLAHPSLMSRVRHLFGLG